MINVKNEMGGDVEGSLNEDQLAAAELVAAAAEVETVSTGGTLSGMHPVSSGQRVIQVIQRHHPSDSASRLSQFRAIHFDNSSMQSSGIVNTNTAPQHLGSMTSLSGPTFIKSSSLLDYGPSKIVSHGSFLSNTMDDQSSMYVPSSTSSQFGIGLGGGGMTIGSGNIAAAAAAASAAATAAGNAQNQNQSSNQSRKPCNCTKSHCLKLYCDCFAQGQLCQNCNCTNCMNNLQYEEERARAIKMTLDRNPMAFHPKIGRGEGERKHTKGCNCKKSGCLKNYCECYEAKISCTDLCRCQGCKNTEDGMERRSLMRLSVMNQAMRSRQQIHARKSFIGPAPETLPHNFITWEVAESACGCMLAQADDAERRDMLPAAQERIILEEFGRCLSQIVESASRAQPMPSYAPDATVQLRNTSTLRSSASAGLIMHRGGHSSMDDLDIPHSHRIGSNNGGDENVIVDV